MIQVLDLFNAKKQPLLKKSNHFDTGNNIKTSEVLVLTYSAVRKHLYCLTCEVKSHQQDN